MFKKYRPEQRTNFNEIKIQNSYAVKKNTIANYKFRILIIIVEIESKDS